MLIEHFDVDLALVGANSDVALPADPVWTGKGISMYYTRKGGINILKTLWKNSIFRIRKEIRSIPVQEYDFVINDYESISVRAAKRHGIPVLGISHQAAVLDPKSPKSDAFMPLGKWIMPRYAPVENSIGFHFESYSESILTPVFSPAVQMADRSPGTSVVVYLPAYSVAEIAKHLGSIKEQFEVFHRTVKNRREEGNITWNPIDHDYFVQHFLAAKAVLCSAGFELPSESIHHGIPLVVVPIKGQYEQWCNAQALKEMGVKVVEKLSSDTVRNALELSIANPMPARVYPDIRPEVIARIKSWWQEMRK